MKRRILSLTAALALALSMLSGMTLTAHAAYGGGSGSFLDPYQIKTAAQLKELATAVNSGNSYSGSYFALANDINLGGSASNVWTSIGVYGGRDGISYPFDGVFDGKNHTISGLYASSNEWYQGLFGNNTGEIKNLIVSGTVYDDVSYAGGICAVNSGTISNCTNRAKVSSKWEVAGGICSENSGTIENCINEGEVSANNNAGGIVGRNTGVVKGSHNTGKVSGWESGGVCGENSETINDCYNSGIVSGEGNVGGICGVNSGSISNSYNLGVISGTSYVGGVCGAIRAFSNTKNLIEDCYNTAMVTGTSKVGGVIGENPQGGTVKNCYNTGTIIGNSVASASEFSAYTAADLGAICGSNSGTVTGCYYLNSCGASDADATALTAAQFKEPGMFNAFGSAWVYNETLGRPVIASNNEAGSSAGGISMFSPYLPSGTINKPYAAQIALNGYTSFELIGNFKPAGLDFNGTAFTQNGVITGTPTAPGNYAMFVRATDASGNTRVDLIHIYIAPIF